MPRSFRDCIAGLIASAAVIGFGARDGSAQSLWIPRDRGGSVTLEALKPSLELVDQDFFSAALFLNVRAPIGGSTFLVAEVPYASFHGDFALFITDDTGNLGGRAETQLEFHADFGPWRVRPGVEMKLPLGAAASYVPIVLGASVSVGL